MNWIINRAKQTAAAKVYPVGAVTVGLKGRKLTQILQMKRAGCAAFSDDGHCVMNDDVLRRALQLCKKARAPLIEHAEDETLSHGGSLNEGKTASELGCLGIPRESETIMVARDILLAQETNSPIHCAHVSTHESVELLRAAKKMGIPVTAETCPHYFTLTEESIKQHGTHAKMKPPLRTHEDRLAVIRGLSDNTIDIIATDHAPHSARLKRKKFHRAPFGIIGLETLFALSYNELVLKKSLTLKQLISKLTIAPARIFALNAGTLRPGHPADIALFNPTYTWTLHDKDLSSHSRNTPFIGRKFKGRGRL